MDTYIGMKLTTLSILKREQKIIWLVQSHEMFIAVQ